MKKGIGALLLGLVVFSMGTSVYADEQDNKPIKLKSKCIKQNPLADGQTDQALLAIYQQVCDKANAQRSNDLLAQAAMRMYELKQPLNALTLAKQLQQQNVRGATLTDVTFLASVAIANDALHQMRSNEMRYLSNELTYPPAKELSDNIRTALPAPDTTNIKAITEESLKQEAHNTGSRSINTRTKVRVTSPVRTKVVTPVKRQVAVTPTVVKQPVTVQKTGANPFDSLK